jgi:hypothetical protein
VDRMTSATVMRFKKKRSIRSPRWQDEKLRRGD